VQGGHAARTVICLKIIPSPAADVVLYNITLA